MLRDSRERLQLVLDLTDASRDGLFIIDPQSRDILHMNQAMYSSLDYSAEAFSQLLKEDPEQLLPDFHQWLEGVRQAQQDKLSQIFQQQMRRRDGSLQAAEISAQLDFAPLVALAPGAQLELRLPLLVNLHGHSHEYRSELLVTRLDDRRFQVVTLAPLVLNAADFGLAEGLENLRALAGLPAISLAVPVSAVLIFNAR